MNAVCPGTVDTDLINREGKLARLLDATGGGGFDGWVRREIPVGRLETADDVASAIAFLSSADAGCVTGKALNVTGGQTMV